MTKKKLYTYIINILFNAYNANEWESLAYEDDAEEIEGLAKIIADNLINDKLIKIDAPKPKGPPKIKVINPAVKPKPTERLIL